MKEYRTYSSFENQPLTKVAEPSVDLRDSETSQLDTLIGKLRKDPYRVINNPELTKIAAAWSLQTVEVFHQGMGIPNSLVETNRLNREEELNERIEKLHGDETVRATNGKRKAVAAGLTQVFVTTTEIWDGFTEEQRRSVEKSLEKNGTQNGEVIFSAQTEK